MKPYWKGFLLGFFGFLTIAYGPYIIVELVESGKGGFDEGLTDRPRSEAKFII